MIAVGGEDSQVFQQHMGIAFRDGRLPAVLFCGEKVPLTFRIASEHEVLRERYSFIKYQRPSNQLLAAFQIKPE